ncbi:MAG TPA: hypothetical protein VE778_00195 [Candidatus Bathyarchaeia archaeon]|jgi:hypothetical protein|nr:hypothetical protein [Candidatus Bathyarchaeia archaeon]
MIRGERIEQIASEGKVEIPLGAPIVDARGKWIIPGLIDSHAHAGDYAGDPLKLYLANGVTTIRNPGGNVTSLRLTREKLESGKMVGPRLYFFCFVMELDSDQYPLGRSADLLRVRGYRYATRVLFLKKHLNLSELKCEF